jgi:hypothetical protein
MSDVPFGEQIQQQVNLAIVANKQKIEAAVEAAKKAGVGVWVGVAFGDQGEILLDPQPSVRVAYGLVQGPDFSRFTLPKKEETNE